MVFNLFILKIILPIILLSTVFTEALYNNLKYQYYKKKIKKEIIGILFVEIII